MHYPPGVPGTGLAEQTGALDADNAVREREERYLLVRRATNDVIWDWDLETNRLDWNEAIVQHFGWEPGEPGPSFEEWSERVHPDDRERVVRELRAAIDGGSESWAKEYRFRKRDGSYATFLDRGYVARDASGRAYRMIGSMLDVTERRRVEDALREADRRKDNFMAMLAHELRNPLAPIRTAVYVLRRSVASEPALEHVINIIDRQVAHMARLIDDLLDVSRIARGKIDLRKERCDLVQIVRQTADDYRTSLHESGVTISVSTPDEPVWVDGDRTRLAQVLGNLLHNAGKFSGPGSRVTVRLDVEPRAPRPAAVMIIEDNGIGIEPALLPHLFDPFTQADQGLGKGGLGLGLSLVKGLVEIHGGTVAVHSEGLGHGSRFTLRLPLMGHGGS